MEYVSPEYEARLERLANTLCTPERFGQLVLGNEAQLELPFEVPDNIELGVE